MADSPEAIKKSVKLYCFIGLLLFFGTVVTVAVAVVPWLDFGARGFDTADCVIGLTIATIKASLVMLIFMHLNHEKPMIYGIYLCGIFMAFWCMALIWGSKADPINYGDEKKADGFYNAGAPPAPVLQAQ